MTDLHVRSDGPHFTDAEVKVRGVSHRVGRWSVCTCALSHSRRACRRSAGRDPRGLVPKAACRTACEKFTGCTFPRPFSDLSQHLAAGAQDSKLDNSLPGGIRCRARFGDHAMILVTQSVFPASAALASRGLVSCAEVQAPLSTEGVRLCLLTRRRTFPAVSTPLKSGTHCSLVQELLGHLPSLPALVLMSLHCYWLPVPPSLGPADFLCKIIKP